MEKRIFPREKAEAVLSQLISDEQLEVYGALIETARSSGLRMAVGGGLGSSAYSGYVRNTKDMDLFVVDPDQNELIEIMKSQGFSEYTEVDYDRTWSYRGSRNSFIVDLLWRMLNGRGAVDEAWIASGWELEVRGVPFQLVAPEELLWSKLYILRRDRSDWPDILNIIYAQGPGMDWARLLGRLQDDAAVLGAVLSLFRWMCPGRAAEMPPLDMGEGRAISRHQYFTLHRQGENSPVQVARVVHGGGFLMLIGAMNHPGHNVVEEISWMKALGLDFIDLTLEPPAAGHWQIDVNAVLQALDHHRMGIVGHTAYYLPLGHPFEEVRAGAVAAFKSSLEIFATLGATTMNIHPDFKAPMHDAAFSVEQNLKSIRELLPTARRLGIILMIENLPHNINDPIQLGWFLDAIPELGLHLDIGHTNLTTSHNTTATILQRYGDRVKHVHLHDNRGGTDDLHLPLGAGTLDLPACLGALKGSGYDGTITLEVFTPDLEFVRY